MTRLIIRSLLGSVLLLAALVAPVLAERPTASHLLPEGTLAYVRISDSRELVKRFNETAMGRIGQDDQVRPLVGQLYSSVSEVFAQIEDEVGLPLDKILALPQGELCFAVTAPAAGPPAIVVMIEAGDQMPSLNKLIARGEDLATAEGATKSSEVRGEVKINKLTIGDEAREEVIYFEKEGVFVLANEPELINHILDAWEGKLKKDAKTLADDQKFVTVMNRCLGSKDDPPQFAWYVDPIRTAKVASRGNAGAQTVIALLPAIGLDGLQAIGGSVTMATGEFDSIGHFHVMIDEPRSGVLEAIAITSGDTTPEPWVPADAASYMTINFDVERSYDAIAKVYNSLAGENALQNEVQRRINDELGVDFREELLGASAGRFTMLSRIEKPVTINSQGTLIGVKLKDAEKFGELLKKLTEKYSDNIEKTAYGTTPYWQIKVPEPPAPQEDDEERPGRRRRVQLGARAPQPCFAILEDYLLFADRPSLLEHAIVTAGDSSKSLAKDLEFKLIMSKIKRQPGGETPGMISFNRPEEGMRMLYDLANSDAAKEFLANRAAEDDGFFKNVDQAMKDNPLPPFAVIAKYLAPGGGLLTSDETGIHYASFQLRRK